MDDIQIFLCIIIGGIILPLIIHYSRLIINSLNHDIIIPHNSIMEQLQMDTTKEVQPKLNITKKSDIIVDYSQLMDPLDPDDPVVDPLLPTPLSSNPYSYYRYYYPYFAEYVSSYYPFYTL